MYYSGSLHDIVASAVTCYSNEYLHACSSNSIQHNVLQFPSDITCPGS